MFKNSGTFQVMFIVCYILKKNTTKQRWDISNKIQAKCSKNTKFKNCFISGAKCKGSVPNKKKKSNVP